jgi:predicted TIM-barrel fold metal-dependent hydrolase
MPIASIETQYNTPRFPIQLIVSDDSFFFAFFGADNMVFAGDYPYPGGPEQGDIAAGEVIKSVDMMSITPGEKAKIFSGNARRLLKLS